MRITTLAMALIAILSGTAAATADNYPSHPITLPVGFPPGGPTDALARLLAKGMEKSLHQTIVVETVFLARAMDHQGHAGGCRRSAR
jgi:tripartite-type tricarboxylate transporter receptor subunit TctC